jgi:hypothetical protein
MRHGTGPRLILFACAGATLSLSACGGREAARNDEADYQVRLASVAAGATLLPRRATADSRTAPVTDALHFDLVCDVRGRVISDPHPENYHGTWPAGIRAWHDHTRFIVDLQAMRSCEPAACLYYEPPPIVSATSKRITFVDNPGAHISIRIRDLQYQQRMEEFGAVSVTRGHCVKTRFSGFPARLPGWENRSRGQ